ncbi:ferroxidase [Fistulina hepatica ATCC 64428]|uniref:Ferroxidase n=1 Tax=Fistulina hepatica ATCC 64428 TaxID=1128425 RepID=A0A0D7A9F9_9AGAR|nr:ferroxidase [Fistulina hepatica ATCC 64428]
MRWTPCRSALALVFAAHSALAGVQEVWWNVSYAYDVNPDGLYPRRAVGVNGSWPIPPLVLSNNDSLVLHTTNSLDDAVSVHHHGMFFNKSSWMDGAVGVSECGIPPNGGTFDYVVPINSSGQAGTYWAHAHSKGQYTDGLRTPLILDAEDELPYDYDGEFVVLMSDWYHAQYSVLINEFISIANPGGAEPVPKAPLIYMATRTTSGSDASDTNPVAFNENATLPFEAGKTYRLRVLNIGSFAMFYVWLDGHDMRLVEVDGTPIEATSLSMLSVAVAQRYSVLVTARNDNATSGGTRWAIHGNMDTSMFDTVPADLNPKVDLAKRYTPTQTVSTTVDTYQLINDTALVPVTAVAAPEPSQTLILQFLFDTMTDGTNHALINGTSYSQAKVPVVLSALSLGGNATAQSAYGPLRFVLDHMDVIDIVIENADTGKHPFHLHGHKFMIVGRSDDYNATIGSAENPRIVDGQTNPMRRDTLHIPSGSSATLRVVADNPGAWFLHCHIEWHLDVGLAVVFVEAPLLQQEYVSNVPDTLYSNCEALGEPTSGNAAGHTSTTDLSGWYLGPFEQHNGWHGKGIGAMFGCVFTAVLGMATVVWYTMGGHTDAEAEAAARAALASKAARKDRIKGLLGLRAREN